MVLEIIPTQSIDISLEVLNGITKKFVIGSIRNSYLFWKRWPIDFSYLNPISTHLEIELNDRQNRSGIDEGNGVWQLSLDYLIMDNLRFSFNYLFDEFILDRSQKNEGKGSGRAYSFKTAYSLREEENSSILCHLSIISVGTNTFRHGKGNNNFVQRGSPLGWTVGSDSREMNLGFD